MPKYHPLKELAPRDVVSRATFEEMQRTSSDHVYLILPLKKKNFNIDFKYIQNMYGLWY